MRRISLPLTLGMWVFSLSMVHAQSTTFPYRQSFDSVATPFLPPGWNTSQNRNPGTNDFTTTSSTPRSVPNAVLSTNATIAQELLSPVLNFQGELPDSIVFHTRRSSTHTAKVVVEASLNGGVQFPILIGDTLTFNGSTNYVVSRFALPLSLSNSPNVRFRWRVIPEQTGSTGTFRLDDVEISVQLMHDLGIDSILFSPRRAVDGDTVIARLTIRNSGLVQSSEFQVSLYQDTNGDSVAQEEEWIAGMVESRAIDPDGVDTVDLVIGARAVGVHTIIGRVTYDQDRNASNNEMIAALRVGYARGAIVVNEIMYAPTGTEPEWIELYNPGNDTIGIQEWLVSDNAVSTKKVITHSNVWILPDGYVVLTKDSAALLDIHPEIEERVINLPGMPTLNNSGDAVVLYDDRVATMDSVSYHPSWGGNSGGKSLERIDALASSTQQSNWGSSRGSTPGRRNSISRKDLDLALDTVSVHPGFPIVGDSLVLEIGVHNSGFLEAAFASLKIFEDRNHDSLGQQNEFIDSINLISISPLDSIITTIFLMPLHPGSHEMLVRSELLGDEDTTNDMLHVEIIVGYPEGSIKLNEVMYAPSSGGPEWVELVSTSEDTLFLVEWTMSNRSVSRYETGDSIIAIPPGSHVVLTKNSSQLLEAFPLAMNVVECPSLPTFLWNNSGDAVVLRDNRGLVMDSLHYSSTWGGTGGRSLERMDVAWSNDSINWNSSEDTLDATPGRANSILRLEHDLRVLPPLPISVEPAEAALLAMTILNAGKQQSSPCTVVFYHDANNDSQTTEIEELARIPVISPLDPGDTIRVEYSWTNPPPGQHSVIGAIEYVPDQRLSNNTGVIPIKCGFLPGAVIINEIMYEPLSGQAEYVELYNRSGKDVDLARWKLSDRPSSSGSVNTVTLSSSSRVVHAGEFLVIGNDTSLFVFFPHLRQMETRLLLVGKFVNLGLNNDGDAVILKDLTGSLIDSIAYFPTWHNPGVHDVSGRSLERINPFLEGNERRNWSTSTLSTGGTPGKPNSIYTNEPAAVSTINFSPNPFSPDGDGHEDFTVIHYAVPLPVSVIRMRVFDTRGRVVRTLANNEPGGPEGNVVWDGRDDESERVRIGIYIVLFEAIDGNGGVLEVVKSVVVVAARL